ncbi:MAG TPA: hypothetical protein DHV89_06185 [Ruminococcus sp.]|nr:hypothetical protein [Ruminococcus sp.]
MHKIDLFELFAEKSIKNRLIFTNICKKNKNPVNLEKKYENLLTFIENGVIIISFRWEKSNL